MMSKSDCQSIVESYNEANREVQVSQQFSLLSCG